MNAFLEPLQHLADIEELEVALEREPGVYAVSGCTDAQKSHLIYGLRHPLAEPRLIVTFSEQKAWELMEACRFFSSSVHYYPAKDFLFYQSDVRGLALGNARMRVYRALEQEEAPVVITTMDALMNRLVPPAVFSSFILSIGQGDELDLEKLRKRLVQMGYTYNHQAQEPGQFAVRGGILDIFPLTEETPYRIEFWGDEVDSIRSFSPESQRSLENVEEIRLFPASELVLMPGRLEAGLRAMGLEARKRENLMRSSQHLEEANRLLRTLAETREKLEDRGDVRWAESLLSYFYEEAAGFLDYLSFFAGKKGRKPLIFIDEPVRCGEEAVAVEQEFFASMEHRLDKGYAFLGQMKMLDSFSGVVSALQKQRCVLLAALEVKNFLFSPRRSFSVQVKSINAYNGSFSLLVQDLQTYRKEKYSVLLLSGSRSRAERMARDLLEEGLTAFYCQDPYRAIQPGEVMVCYGLLPKGFSYPELKFVVLTETDIFGAEKKKRKKAKKAGAGLSGFDELKPGDYVIHENHGLGVFRGIEKVEVNHTQRDYMKIEYDGGGTLYVLATQLDVIQKYTGPEGKHPKLNRLGGQEWKKTKARTRQAIQVVARELVELYAARQKSNGFAYGEDTVWQKEFEEMFPFMETEDQLTAIAATKADMESTKIMDRLICGDVGFGKTEVALRAAFKAVQENKQVVYLVPTTILAQQHYNHFVQRLKNFPVNVELLCRFRTPAQQRETIKRLKQGLTDIVIGTHRVLSGDVEYRDLGLLIIDEEQRFGVKDKEKIKQLKTNVDVLTLTATPIPRTLHMSLVGIRDMSVLEEPPLDRKPIQTYVMEYDEEMVREAIARELARGGQVYYVYNRVKTIVEATNRLAKLMPEAEIAFAHGQMSERELERIMYRFINGEIDVLVSTTIIETGLDIGNVNTMIIHDADRLGLSQLYQLRGRIGRSNRTAYAFLLYQRHKVITEVAQKRLTAIREFTELGSGIRIAMRDLEIRGAGTVLGTSQHGMLEAVGYELYCKMLGEAVRQEKGEAPAEDFDTVIDVELDAYLPSAYISNEQQKLDIYKRIAAIRSQQDQEEMLDELIDRFGEPPRPAQNLLLVAQLRQQAHGLYVTEIKESQDMLCFTLYERAQLDVTKIPELIRLLHPHLRFVADAKRPALVYDRRKTGLSAMEIMKKVLKTLEVAVKTD